MIIKTFFLANITPNAPLLRQKVLNYALILFLCCFDFFFQDKIILKTVKAFLS